MSANGLSRQLAEAQATVRALHQELAETNRGLLALTVELEKRVEERTADLRATQAELQQTNSELLQLTLELEDRVAQRTAALQEANTQLQRELEERRRVEAELRRAEESLRRAHDELEQRVKERTAALQEANNEIRRFAYIVSHDLRAPLINLHGFTGELRDACIALTAVLLDAVPHLEGRQGAAVTRALKAEIPEALGFIETSVRRMDRLIEAVLQLSHLGRQELQLEPVATEALVHETLRTLAHQIAQRQVQVRVGPLPVVHADRLALAQIFGNLLANAVAYLEPERPGEIAVSAEQRPGVTVFAVQDNGQCIAAADMTHVFEPFRRFGRQDVPGEGMGLAYVRTLVQRHGGNITCQSTLGVGTTFTFTMPATVYDDGVVQGEGEYRR